MSEGHKDRLKNGGDIRRGDGKSKRKGSEKASEIQLKLSLGKVVILFVLPFGL